MEGRWWVLVDAFGVLAGKDSGYWNVWISVAVTWVGGFTLSMFQLRSLLYTSDLTMPCRKHAPAYRVLT